MEQSPLDQLELRHLIEKAIEELGGHIMGAGTNLLNGEMDVSFEYNAETYRLGLKLVNRVEN